MPGSGTLDLMTAGSPPSPSSPLRQQVEARTRPLLVRLHRLPRPLIPLATVLAVGVGVLAPLPVALVALLLVFGFVAWIAYVSWPVVPTSGRLVRLLMLALIVTLALTRL